MNKESYKFVTKFRNKKNAYTPTRMRLRKKLGKSCDDYIESNNEIIDLMYKLPNKVVGIRLSRKTMVSALIGSQSCWEQRLEWLSNPILAWQSLPQLLQIYGVA